MKNSIFILIFVLLASSCSKKGMTPAKVKLNIAGMITIANGAGNGGAILYGRSSTGEIFGRAIVNNAEDMILPNGDWTFYAFMWDSVSVPAMPLNDNVYCGKSVQKLSGLDTSITMNLSNANCTDPEFSGGKTYVDGLGKNRFADIFLEECDELNAATGFTCGHANQGSALSYRVIIKNFNKNPSSPLNLGPAALASSCQKINRSANDLLQKGLPVNFPSGNGTTPFIVEVEMFLKNDVCDATDPQGVYRVALNQGFGTQNPVDDKMIIASNICSFQPGSITGTPEQIKTQCEDYFSVINGGTCLTSAVPATISRFAPAGICTTPSTFSSGPVAIKHIVTIPKPFLCDRYLNQSAAIGAHPFAGGNGSIDRPYKICTEWQLNQIGEYNTPNYSASSFKLMNDLDMNKTDFSGAYAKPSCVGVTGSLVDRHHNFNPLDKLTTDCITLTASGTNPFTGTFDGNNKKIANLRIEAKSATDVGFVRAMVGGATVKNLRFDYSEIRGTSNIGGVAGNISGATAEIKNITMYKSRIEADSNGGAGGNYVGAIVGGFFQPGGSIINAKAVNVFIRGNDNVGGLVGQLQGSLMSSSFRGDVEVNNSGGIYTGGLVGVIGSGGSISDSFSEGSIASAAAQIGGIAGLNNTGTINRVYSTMSLIQNNTSSGMTVGGIIANNQGILTDAYFDGAIKAMGAAPTLNGGVAAGGGTASNCIHTISAVGGTCTNVAVATLRNGSQAFGSAFFKQLSGSIPRLIWETRECLDPVNQQSFATQITNFGRGSLLNPFIICNSAQLKSVSARAAAEYYRVAEDVNIADWTLSTDLISVFNGTLNGNGNIIYGLNFSTTNASDEGLIRVVAPTGSIVDTHFYANSFTTTSSTAGTAVGGVIGENLGVLKNTDVKGVTVGGTATPGSSQVGIIAGYNNGLISHSDIAYSVVSGVTSVGGLAGFNDVSGQIILNDVNATISSLTASYSQFGGIVGYNKGLIDQNRYGGELFLATAVSSAASGIRAGGLVGFNQGTISNSYTDNYSRLTTMGSSISHKVGGIVGENTGNINRSFNLGKVIYSNGNAAVAAPLTFGALVGSDTGTIAGDTYFLENNTASLAGTLSATPATNTCTGTGPYTCSVTGITVPTPVTAAGANMFSPQNNFGGGQLSTLILATITVNSFSYSSLSATPVSVSSINPVNFYVNYTTSPLVAQSRTIASIGDINTFCPGGWSGTAGNETCVSGYDIIGVDKATNIRYGENRMIDYYKSIMYGTPTPANAPIWELDHDGNPTLMQLEHF